MKCSQCENKVTMIGATTCSLKCACDLNWDSYDLIRARLSNAIALSKMPCKHKTKAKAEANRANNAKILLCVLRA